MENNNCKTIVFLCDVNNVLLMIASQLYRKGMKVKYIPDLKLNQHFRIWDAPIDAEYGVDKFADFSNNINIDKNLITNYTPQVVREILLSQIGENAIVVGSDYAPAIFEYANLTLDYFVVTGADVNNHTILAKRTAISVLRNMIKNYRSSRDLFGSMTKSVLLSPLLPNLQRLGIYNSKVIINSAYFNWYPLEDIKYTMLPYPLPGAKSDYSKTIYEYHNFPLCNIVNDLKKNTDLIIVNISKNDYWKGTQIFFEGFDKYIKTSRIKAKLLINGRGNLESLKSKYKYIGDLICSGDIVVLPSIPQRDINVLLSNADLCFGSISDTNYLYDWNTSMMQYCEMCKPIITYCPFENFSGFKDINVYPHVSAKNADEVCIAIQQLESSKLRSSISSNIGKWNKSFSDKAIDMWINELKKEI